MGILLIFDFRLSHLHRTCPSPVSNLLQQLPRMHSWKVQSWYWVKTCPGKSKVNPIIKHDLLGFACFDGFKIGLKHGSIGLKINYRPPFCMFCENMTETVGKFLLGLPRSILSFCFGFTLDCHKFIRGNALQRLWSALVSLNSVGCHYICVVAALCLLSFFAIRTFHKLFVSHVAA